MIFTRYGINLFIATMITVMGVVYLPLIETPLEIYYDVDVTHTTEYYSYKPGQSGTNYMFFIQRQDRGYDQLGYFKSIAIPTLFYFGLITLIGAIRFFIRKLLPKKEPEKPNAFRKEASRKLDKLREKSRKRNPILVLLPVLLVAGFFYSGRSGIFGLGYSNLNSAVKETASFYPTHLVYGPNGEGSGDIWLIKEDKNAEGATFIADESEASFDSIIYTVQVLDQETNERIPIDRFVVSNETGSFDPFWEEGKIWLTARPNMMCVYDTKERSVVYESTRDFRKPFDDLRSGINNYYRHDFDGFNVFRIETMDGGQFYYQFELGELSDRLADFRGKVESKVDGPFELKKENGRRWNVRLKSSRGSEILGDKVFTDAELLAQTDDLCFIYHAKDVSENAVRVISAIDKEGEILWSVESNEFPKKQKEEYMPGDVSSSAMLDGNVLVVEFIMDWKTAGIMGIDISSGKIDWKYDYDELTKGEVQ